MRILKKTSKPKSSESGKKQTAEITKKTPAKINEINAVIAAAVYLTAQEIHDSEQYVLTIKRIDKIYSPWSSKIYGLRKSPR